MPADLVRNFTTRCVLAFAGCGLIVLGPSANALESTDAVPGAGFVVPASAGERLQGMATQFAGSVKTPTRKVGEIVSADIRFAELQPSEQEMKQFQAGQPHREAP